ncbi:MazG-like family protein [Solibacillus sp. FSL R7-0668]|uniref:MazG-like family protein n=1 Tax=Solibacillus sp. FSL R7-0668 TaxID=2921688 RepID=UPI0030FBAA59
MDKLVSQVGQWSIEKGLHQADSSKQFLKVTEEVGEVAAALARNDKDALKDGIGDVVVTLIILAQQNNLTLHECLQCAYDEIKGRTGQMVNGVFVKSSDL